MKALVLVTSAFEGIGGIETFNRSLVRALDDIAAERSWTVEVLSLLDCDEVPSAARYLPSSRTTVRGFSGNRALFTFLAAKASSSADLVIFGHVNLIPLALVMNNSFKYLITHGVEVWRSLPRLKRLSIKRVNRILCVSAYTQWEMMRLNGLHGDRFCVFPNTLDPLYPALERITINRHALGLPTGRMLLSVARLAASERYKNIQHVISSLPTVLKQVPDVFYVIVGDGSERKRLEHLASSLGLTKKVFFAGTVSEDVLPSYYENCDVFILPSLKEGFGIVFLEAMYHRKPCIGAAAGGIPEVVRDGKTGLLVDASNLPAVLPEAILRLLLDPVLRTTMGVNGRADLESKFSFNCFRDRLEQILCTSNGCASMSA